MKVKVVVSGSFRKHLDSIKRILNKLQSEGIEVLAPSGTDSRNPTDDFVILTTDKPGLSPLELETNFMKNIINSNLLLIANVDGYIGNSMAAEMALAKLNDLPIIIIEPIKEMSDEIPIAVQDVLKQIPIDVLNPKDLTDQKLNFILKKVEKNSFKKISRYKRSLLQSSVNTLLKSLKR